MKIEDHLKHILKKVAEAQNIRNFKLNIKVDASQGDGMVADFYVGDILDKETGNTISLAIKKARVSDSDYGIAFRNEDLFYCKIFPALDNLQKENDVLEPFNNIPKYFSGSVDPKKEYIAMEHLRPQGYVLFDKKNYLDRQHLELTFKTYGKFHALSYILRSKNQEKYESFAKELKINIPEFIGKQMITAVTAAVSALDSENDRLLYEEIQDFGENTYLTYLKTFSYNGNHKCLIHGDCWSNNMMFKYAESGDLVNIKLIDFQICRDDTPIHDLSYFFYSGASKQDFDNLDSYLQIYYNSFSQFVKELNGRLDELISFEEFKYEWKENAIFGIILGIFLWQVKLIPKEDFAFIDNPSSREKLPQEERSKLWEVLLNKVHKTESYRERTTAILRHAFEYGILSNDKIVRNTIIKT